MHACTWLQSYLLLPQTPKLVLQDTSTHTPFAWTCCILPIVGHNDRPLRAALVPQASTHTRYQMNRASQAVTKMDPNHPTCPPPCPAFPCAAAPLTACFALPNKPPVPALACRFVNAGAGCDISKSAKGSPLPVAPLLALALGGGGRGIGLRATPLLPAVAPPALKPAKGSGAAAPLLALRPMPLAAEALPVLDAPVFRPRI